MSTSAQYANALYRDITAHSPAPLCKRLPPEIGEGQIYRTMTKQGVVLSDWRMNYAKDMPVQGVSGAGYVQIIFCLSDGIAWEDTARAGRLGLDKGGSCLYRCSDAPEKICYPKGCDFHFKSVKIPEPYLQGILEQYLEGAALDRLTRKLYAGPAQTGMTAPMERVLHEMTNPAGYPDGFGDLYLESKALELICVYLHALLGDAHAGQNAALSMADRRALADVKRALDSDIAAAPGCGALARQAGVSVTKFTRGFQALYGMPVHAYIIDRRLEKAALLLAEGGLNVGQIAMLVGYSNAGHFAAAFKRKYGLSPKQYIGK